MYETKCKAASEFIKSKYKNKIKLKIKKKDELNNV